VLWENSSGTPVDITNYLTNGKLGGWLEMRDGIVAKYKLDLDAVAKEFAWSVNEQHSQGVGITGFSSVTGTYAATDPTAAITASGLSYQNKVVDTNKTFKIWLFDTNDNPYDSDTSTSGLQGNPIAITVTPNMTVNQLVAAVDNATGVQASLDSQNRVTIGINTGEIATLGSLAFSDDDSNVLAALGINTFFQGSGAGSIDINDTISGNKNYIAASQVYNNVGSAVAASTNVAQTGNIITDGPYTGTADATYYIKITAAGDQANTEFDWSIDQTNWFSVDLGDGDPSGTTRTLSNGVTVTFNTGDYELNNSFTIVVTEPSGTYGTFADGDNTNALAIADLQYTDTAITRTTVDRIDGNTTETVTATIEGYYHVTIGSIGITSSSIVRAKEFNEIMVNKFSTVRDAISAVSLDEEMANLIKFQHAYAAAAKIINVADEMYVSLLQTK
jgi:flagellar hook-associated protein FlgK